MAEVRRISVPPVPQGADPEMRNFLTSLRSFLLARDGQTKVSRREGITVVTMPELREILPGMVELLVREGVKDIILNYISNAENLYVQPGEPDFRGQTGVWVQTGLSGGDFTIWIEDGS